VFVQQLHYWLNETQAGRTEQGRRWVYNTYEEWLKQFPFWSIATLRRIIGGLEAEGLVLSTQEFNEHPADRTKWYSLDYDAIDAVESRLSKSAAHVINMISPSAQDAQLEVRNLSSSSSKQESTQKSTHESGHQHARETDLDSGSAGAEGSRGAAPAGMRASVSGARGGGRRAVDDADDERRVVEAYAADYGREFHDDRPVAERVATLLGMWRRARARGGCDEARFVGAMRAAKYAALRRSAWMKSDRGGATAGGGGGAAGASGGGAGSSPTPANALPNRMPVFLAELEKELGI
jgi:hypothetical protein